MGRTGEKSQRPPSHHIFQEVVMRRFTLADYIVAALLGAAIGAAAAYIIHADCQEQAAEVQAYLDSDQYRIDRAAHMRRLEGIR